MKRITTNDDIRFPISVVKGLDSDVFTIQFYTTSKAVNITKTNEDVVDGIIHLEWTELYPLGTGVMNYTVLIPEEDGSYSDDTFNRSISGTTIFYIVSNIIVPDGDDAQNLIDLVAELDTKLDAEISRSTGKDSEHDTAIAGKANKNGSASEAFNTYTLNLRREGANTSLYNYNLNGEEYVSFYDQTGGSLTYHFTPNQGDNIATERQLAEKANSSDVYTKAQVDLFLEGSEGLLEEPTEKLPKYSTSHPIRILGIGNSYMTEGTRELVGFLTAEGLTENELDLEIAYYPARTLDEWYEAIRDGGGYEQLVQFKYNSSTHNWYRTAEHNVANIRDTISEKAWDLIILQEFPSFSNSNPHASEYYSYYETLSSIITLCKSLCPNAGVQFGWHMIWSNDQYIANNYSVWEKICDACMRTAKLSDVSVVIPSGTALQNAYNTTPFRGYEHHFLLMDQIGHPAAGAARYIISATWFESLIAPIFGRTLIGNGYVPSFTSDGTVTYQDAEVAITSGNVLLAKYCAYSSVFDKYDVNYELEKELSLNYTKAQTDALLDTKADRNGSNQYTFTAKKLGLQNEGAAMVLYDYQYQGNDVFEIYDNEGGSLQYTFNGNNDKIATESQLSGKANSSDVYTKSETYTKSEVNTALSGKANKNGSSGEAFTVNTLNLQREGASTSLYNYKNQNNEEYVSFYDQTGGSLTYKFTANQGDNIATERQVNAVKPLIVNVTVSNNVYSADKTFSEIQTAYNSNREVILRCYEEVYNLCYLESEVQANFSKAECDWVFEFIIASDGTITKLEKTLPTVANSITGANQTSPVTGGVIYTALQGKAGYKEYNSYNAMTADTPANGTICWEGDQENFYIYDSANAEWDRIDGGAGGGDGKQKTILKGTVSSGLITLKDTSNNTLTLQQSLDILSDNTKDVIIEYSGFQYYQTSYSDDSEGYAKEWNFASIDGSAGVRLIDLFYYYEPGEEDDGIGISTSTKKYPTITSLGMGYGNTTSFSTSTVILATTTSSDFVYVNGGIVIVTFGVNVGASATLNINSKGAKSIYYQGSAIQSGVINSGDKALFQYYSSRWNLICTDHPTGGGGGVQSNWNETDTTSLAYIQNKPTLSTVATSGDYTDLTNKPTIPDSTRDLTNDSNFVVATNDTNVINASTIKIFDGIDNYVTLSGDYDDDLDCNTILFSDLFSGNSAQFKLAPMGYRLNLGAYRTSVATVPAAVSGVSTVEIKAGYTILGSRFYRATNPINFNISSPTYSNLVVPEYFIYFPKRAATTLNANVDFTFNMSISGTSVALLWKDGTAPTIKADVSADNALAILVKITLVEQLVAVGEFYKFK